MKTLKVEAVYRMAYKIFEDATADLPASSIRSTHRRLHSAHGYLSPAQFEDHTPSKWSNQPPEIVHSACVFVEARFNSPALAVSSTCLEQQGRRVLPPQFLMDVTQAQVQE